jgi:oligopeptide/dipeptide ABC transporter ATP-binding protein
MVMYAGRIVEEGPIEPIFADPQHPYTLGLLGSMPRLDEETAAELRTIPGQPPNLQALPEGCAFRDRCPFAFERCALSVYDQKQKSMPIRLFLHQFKLILPLQAPLPKIRSKLVNWRRKIVP